MVWTFFIVWSCPWSLKSRYVAWKTFDLLLIMLTFNTVVAAFKSLILVLALHWFSSYLMLLCTRSSVLQIMKLPNSTCPTQYPTLITYAFVTAIVPISTFHALWLINRKTCSGVSLGENKGGKRHRTNFKIFFSVSLMFDLMEYPDHILITSFAICRVAGRIIGHWSKYMDASTLNTNFMMKRRSCKNCKR